MKPKLSFVVDLAKQVGNIAVERSRDVRQLAKKDDRDVQTNVDVEIENELVQSIQQHFPEHNIIREEREDINNGSLYTWLLDPIDGTKYYIKGVKLFTTSISLYENNRPILGVVYNPSTKECFSAERGRGAFVNGDQLHVSTVSNFAEAIIHINYFRLEKLSSDKRAELFKQLENISKNFYRFRAYGLGSLALCMLAQGYFDAYYDITGGEEMYNLGAGLLIVEEAGGKVTDREGRYPGLNAEYIVVTNSTLHDKLLELLKTI